MFALVDFRRPGYGAWSLAGTPKHDSLPVRLVAARIFARAGEQPPETLALVREGVRNRDSSIRMQALKLAGALDRRAGEAVELLVEVLRGPSLTDYVAKEAIAALGALGATAVRPLLDVLEPPPGGPKRPSDKRRLYLLDALAEIAAREPSFVATHLFTFEEILRDRVHSSPEVRLAAARVIVRCGRQPPEILEIAIKEGRRLDSPKRAIELLAELDQHQVKVIEALVGLGCYSNLQINRPAGEALTRLGPSALAEVGWLLQNGEDYQAACVVNLLRWVDLDLGPIAPAITVALESRPAHIQDDIVRLMTLRPRVAEQALPVLTRLVGSDEPVLRLKALRALDELGPAARPAQAALERLTEDLDPEVHRLATRILARIRPDEKAERTP